MAPPPNKANSGASSIWDQVKEKAQMTAPESSSAAGSTQNATIIITRYSNGFTINNGPLRSADSPEGIQFFSLLARNLIPKGTCQLVLNIK